MGTSRSEDDRQRWRCHSGSEADESLRSSESRRSSGLSSGRYNPGAVLCTALAWKGAPGCASWGPRSDNMESCESEEGLRHLGVLMCIGRCWVEGSSSWDVLLLSSTPKSELVTWRGTADVQHDKGCFCMLSITSASESCRLAMLGWRLLESLVRRTVLGSPAAMQSLLIVRSTPISCS